MFGCRINWVVNVVLQSMSVCVCMCVFSPGIPVKTHVVVIYSSNSDVISDAEGLDFKKHPLPVSHRRYFADLWFLLKEILYPRFTSCFFLLTNNCLLGHFFFFGMNRLKLGFSGPQSRSVLGSMENWTDLPDDLGLVFIGVGYRPGFCPLSV